MAATTERVRERLHELVQADPDLRWVWKELLIVQDIPALLAQISDLEVRLETANAVINELRAEVSYLTQVSRGAW